MDPTPPQRGVGPSAPRTGPADRRVVEQVRRSRPGNAVVRITRPKFTGFARRGSGHLEASLTLEEPRGPWGKVWRVLVGAPIHSELEINERLTKKKALAVFSSDALSSVAYAPQATLVVLLAAGAGGAVLVAADFDRGGPAAGGRRLQLSPDDLCLPVGRRQLHRRPREPGRDPRAWSPRRLCRSATS